MSKALVHIRRAALLALLVGTACTTNDMGAGPTFGNRFAIRPNYPPLFAQFASQLAIEQVRIAIMDMTEATRLSTTVPFSADLDTIGVPLSIPLKQPVETLFVSLYYETAQGQVLFSGSSQLEVASSLVPVRTPQIPVSYVGPGTNAATIQISPRDTVVTGGVSVPLSVSAADVQGVPVSQVYVSWSSSNSVAPVNALGVVRTPATAGQVWVYARTPNQLVDSTTVTFTSTSPVAGALTGLVLDAATNLGIGGVTVDFFDQGGKQAASVVTAPDGSYTSPTLPAGTYSATATLTGYVTVQLFGATPAGSTQPTTLPTIPLVPSVVGAGGGTVFGTVRDARTNLGVTFPTVEVRSGVNNVTGTLVESVVADSFGNFTTASLAAGTYTLVSKAAGYVDGSRTAIVLAGGGLDQSQDLLISPTGASEVRMVLSWGATPYDLDSHLTGPDPSNPTPGSRFHVYYSNPGSLTAPPYANLDYDVTTGYGPETITITQQAAGIYRYSVHDFSDAGDTASTALSLSGARVDLYIKGALVQQFFVPVNKVGTLWTVFELDGQTVAPINLMSNQASSDAVTTAPYTSIGGSDAGVIGAAVQAHPKP